MMQGPPIKLRWYQEEAVQSLFDFFNDPARAHSLEPANPLICLPTGTGKSVVIAEFFRRALMAYPSTRALMATHVKELVKQNAAKMQEIWPMAPLGIYSAGLGQRDSMQPLIFGGIKSMAGKFPALGRRDLLGIDEAHLLSPNADTTYGKFIEELKYGIPQLGHNGGPPIEPDPQFINPYLKIIGFTATPYRLGLGHMTNGGIFTHVAYDMCNIDGFARLMAEAYLCPVIAPSRDVDGSALIQVDTSNVGITNGDFNQGQAEAAFDQEKITFQALKQLVTAGRDRRSWLIFASGISHAEHICEMLNTYFGIPTVVIHSKKSEGENDKNLALWKSGQVRCAVNMNGLTTGVDHPACDLIGVLRMTMSPGLWVQMLGRGTRPLYAPGFNMDDLVSRLAAMAQSGKSNCLVLDFAGNTRRLGPINDPVIPRQKGKGPPGDAPVKICDDCGAYNHASARYCNTCGAEFLFKENINRQASTLELLRSDLPQIDAITVDRMVLSPHTSRTSGKDSIKVSYFCGLRTFWEYISVESASGMFKHKSRDWFRQRYHYSYKPPHWTEDVPPTNAEVLALVNELRAPTRIQVWINKAQPEVVGYEFD